MMSYDVVPESHGTFIPIHDSLSCKPPPMSYGTVALWNDLECRSSSTLSILTLACGLQLRRTATIYSTQRVPSWLWARMDAFSPYGQCCFQPFNLVVHALGDFCPRRRVWIEYGLNILNGIADPKPPNSPLWEKAPRCSTSCLGARAQIALPCQYAASRSLKDCRRRRIIEANAAIVTIVPIKSYRTICQF